jgi:hypothetical protein
MLSKRKGAPLDLPQACPSSDNRGMKALSFHAGPKALARIRSHGLRAADVAIVPGAAGGPKGLILQALDQYVFGEWLPTAPRERTLIGSSIGAWRMAAACQADPAAAFARLGALYCGQRYTAASATRPSPRSTKSTTSASNCCATSWAGMKTKSSATRSTGCTC